MTGTIERLEEWVGKARWVCLAVAAVAVGGCSNFPLFSGVDNAPVSSEAFDYEYIIGPGDNLSIFVWRNSDLSSSVPVRPDGKFSTPLVDDLQASGKTPSQLARDIEAVLAEYIRDPLVTVTVTGFIGEYYEQIRVVGEAARPRSIPYRKNMTALDVMIAVGGLTQFAAGNRTTLVRYDGESQTEFRVRLEDLIRDGDIGANIEMKPGDILIIPEAWF